MNTLEHDDDRAVLGLLVVLLRSLWHWSQLELAGASGAQRSQISRYELGKTAPSEATLKRLAAAARVPWSEARQVLPALCALHRLATRPSGRAALLPDVRRLSATVGRAAAGAFRESVLPFLREHLPILAGLEPPVPEPPPDRATHRAALGLWIILLRSLRIWTQEELASASGVQRSQISSYELGKKEPRRRTLERLAAAAGVPLDEALDVLPFLRDLVRASRGGTAPAAALADRIGRTAESLFRLEVGRSTATGSCR
jgi:transcriptional regulator with XRE-family HTH domain